MSGSTVVATLITLTHGARVLKARGVVPCSRHALESAVARGDLRAKRVAPRVLLIRPVDLDAFAERFCTRVPQPAGKDADAA